MTVVFTVCGGGLTDRTVDNRPTLCQPGMTPVGIAVASFTHSSGRYTTLTFFLSLSLSPSGYTLSLCITTLSLLLPVSVPVGLPVCLLRSTARCVCVSVNVCPPFFHTFCLPRPTPPCLPSLCLTFLSLINKDVAHLWSGNCIYIAVRPNRRI